VPHYKSYEQSKTHAKRMRKQHIQLVMNHTFNATPLQKLQQ